LEVLGRLLQLKGEPRALQEVDSKEKRETLRREWQERRKIDLEINRKPVRECFLLGIFYVSSRN